VNLLIEDYFEAVEVCLIQSPAISSYELIRKEVSQIDGKLRIKSIIEDGSVLEFFIYVSESNGQINLLKYSFHWQSAQKQLIKRWDNAPHYPFLTNAPHHVHLSDDTVEPSVKLPDVFFVMEQIEVALRN